MGVTDEQIRDLIKKHQYGHGGRERLLTTRDRCFYEDSWTETVLDEKAAFRMLKEMELLVLTELTKE